MRSLFLDHYRHAHKSILYYLILSYAFQVFNWCRADTSLDNLEPIKKLMNNGKYDSALQQFQEAISNDPYNHLTYFKRATVFLALDKPESALEDLNKALEIDKDFTPALSQRASLHAKLGNLDQARNDHEQLVKHRPESSDMIIDKRLRSKNYASVECAKVVETNPEAKKASHIINEMIDEYMLNPCKAKIWFVIELCETIQATHIELANYELFSSTPKDFTVYFSDTLPALDWKLVGQFTANDSRTLQAFDLNQVGFGKFIRVELHTHYGNEHYCPISQVKVFGTSMVDEYEKSENLVDNNLAILSNRNNTGIQKSKIKTSAYLVYRKMMTESQICGLSRSPDEKESDITSIRQKEKPSVLINLPQPTQQPVANRTTPLKPSIFVELSNKVKALETASETLMKAQKALETSTKNAKEELRIKMIEFDTKLERLYLCLKVSALIVISMLVYKLMLDLM